MDDVIRHATAAGPRLADVRAAVGAEVVAAGDALTGLVRRVLPAALELCEGRRRNEDDDPAG
jgi:hypothetical protein